MATRKAVKAVGDGYRWFAEEDGKRYRGYTHNLKPLLKSVTYLDQKVNEASRIENPHEWKFRARAHMSQVWEWCIQAQYTMDQWARNDDGARDKFWKWFEQTHTKQCASNIKRM